MIRSAVAGPTPGSADSVFASCSSMAVAISFTGRTMARKAFFTPTPSTEQNRSKNSRSGSVRKPISRGVMRPCIGLPSRYSIVCRLISLPNERWSWRRADSGIKTWYSKAPTFSVNSSSNTWLSTPVIFVINAIPLFWTDTLATCPSTELILIWGPGAVHRARSHGAAGHASSNAGQFRGKRG